MMLLKVVSQDNFEKKDGRGSETACACMILINKLQFHCPSSAVLSLLQSFSFLGTKKTFDPTIPLL